MPNYKKENRRCSKSEMGGVAARQIFRAHSQTCSKAEKQFSAETGAKSFAKLKAYWAERKNPNDKLRYIRARKHSAPIVGGVIGLAALR